MKPRATTENESKYWMSIDELADYLGLSKSTLYKKVHLRKLPYYKLEGSLFFKREDIDSHIEAGKVEPISEII